MEKLTARCMLRTRVGASSVDAMRNMFILSIPCATEDDAPFGWMKARGAYPSLDAAITAAINADVDLDSAVIEKENGVQASVNDWIAVRTAGGDLDVG